MTRIGHIAIWTRDLDRLRQFYELFFGAVASARYESATRKGFTSYFLTFPEGDVSVEIMSIPGLVARGESLAVGYAHLAVSVGSREAVDSLTNRLRDAGVHVRSDPRLTGDGYYESVVEDPDGNSLEIIA
jgi:lactoylglutathione lyase